ncbi:MAG: hypothetical protein KDN22_10295 [Verrucomicrobiae bacterium]|nr:hypothetical protein [Verrucomicrobiae bacterium]
MKQASTGRVTKSGNIKSLPRFARAAAPEERHWASAADAGSMETFKWPCLFLGLAAICVLAGMYSTGHVANEMVAREIPSLPDAVLVRAAKTNLELFFTTTDSEIRAGLIRRPLEIRLLSAFLESLPPERFSVRSFRPGAAMFGAAMFGASGTNFLSIQYVTNEFREQDAVFEITRAGPKIDWQSLLSFSEVPWEKFVAEGSAEERDFRLKMVESDYYNFSFADDQQFRCYKLTDREETGMCWGYVVRGSALDQELNWILASSQLSGAKEARAILKLASPPNGEWRRQVFIRRIVAKDWVLDQGNSYESGGKVETSGTSGTSGTNRSIE